MTKTLSTYYHSGFAIIREQFADDGRAPFETVSVYEMRNRKPYRAIASGFADREDAQRWIDRTLSRQLI